MQQSVAGRAQTEARRQRIVEHVRANGFASVADLAVLVSVSEMTIRRDIQSLAGRHLLRQVHGGANAILDAGEGIDFRLRASRRAETKKAITSAALQYVSPRATIALDSGTTTLELARQLPSDARLLVATHSLPALMALSAERRHGRRRLWVVHFQSHTQSFAGPMALTAIRHLRIETFFMGSTSIRDGFTYVGARSTRRPRSLSWTSATGSSCWSIPASSHRPRSSPSPRSTAWTSSSPTPALPQPALDEFRARGIDIVQVDVHPREAQDLLPTIGAAPEDAEPMSFLQTVTGPVQAEAVG